MEEAWYVDRAKLRDLLVLHPDWPQSQLAASLSRSLSWVKKWCRRLRHADPNDVTVLRGLSRARKSSSQRISEIVIQRILEIRHQPPDGLQRVPGPLTIRYYLQTDESLKASEVYLPRSTSTIWHILDRHGCIQRPQPSEHRPVERPAPMTAWQIDFKPVTTAPPDPAGKQHQVVEIFNVVDIGTSIWVDAQPQADYHAETVLLALTQTFLVHGLPQSMTFDRDPRFVGSWSGRDFPSALTCFLLCLGIQVNICPPRRPDMNAFVERFHRTLEYECLRLHKPLNLEVTCAVIDAFRVHYNQERPNQAISCANRPPYVAFPQLPALPRLPEWIDPDKWLHAIHNTRYKRRVDRNGRVKLGKHRYYVNRALKGRYVALRVDSVESKVVVELEGQSVKAIDIKGLYGGLLEFWDYIEYIAEEARAEWREWCYQQRRTKITM